jgi:hypothetical protein
MDVCVHACVGVSVCMRAFVHGCLEGVAEVEMSIPLPFSVSVPCNSHARSSNPSSHALPLVLCCPGGGAASPGVNLWVKLDGRVISLGGKATVEMAAGDVLTVMTPGGGGCGAPPIDAGAGGVAQQQQQRQWQEGGAGDGRQGGGAAFSVPVRDGGSLKAYRESQESA